MPPAVAAPAKTVTVTESDPKDAARIRELEDELERKNARRIRELEDELERKDYWLRSGH